MLPSSPALPRPNPQCRAALGGTVPGTMRRGEGSAPGEKLPEPRVRRGWSLGTRPVPRPGPSRGAQPVCQTRPVSLASAGTPGSPPAPAATRPLPGGSGGLAPGRPMCEAAAGAALPPPAISITQRGGGGKKKKL